MRLMGSSAGDVRFGLSVNVNLHNNMSMAGLKNALALTELKEESKERIVEVRDQKDPVTLTFKLEDKEDQSLVQATATTQYSGNLNWAKEASTSVVHFFERVLSETEKFSQSLLNREEKLEKDYEKMNNVVGSLLQDLTEGNCAFVRREEPSELFAYSAYYAGASTLLIGDRVVKVEKGMVLNGLEYRLTFEEQGQAVEMSINAWEHDKDMFSEFIFKLTDATHQGPGKPKEEKINYFAGPDYLKGIDGELREKMMSVPGKLLKFVQILDQKKSITMEGMDMMDI